ncbi:cytochrome c nitrite reductase subunit NrfD [Pectobacterium brasiliense]|uniref:Cytochrome c nitrite reductase subunit NrfD n=1 Tax=Pectobacterium brasiliense TaxID=180957 RepID=A0A433NJM5_9GAMM|nr:MULTISPECIES: cytochrome c nitrite reductase subunit NrfD [Pectobacterium]GKW27680.1 cytochrome c nitrite reductase subunit NrfD [Pectobacterium carotovorum subsp. carotovorum]MBN3046423.1 cytochrome c nitrite reductase subunit NrfD [Pectobacterium brasiliense]MBN3075444.1 cytochrome c nitrite reductase subunit NrfD [Pectobacterium brasiliense]MBN3083430.1 cytochrome c nitrite reductase subunit NrfD [Pectobacterium brasiliense]MBN3088970.1 cytochrome c nitrite reductase subunit NrfD [Pectob
MHNAFTFDTLVWDWPIAVYLLLVGISAGMVSLSMLLRHYVPSEYRGSNRIIKATAIVAPLAVILGLVILIFHLTRPLTFWYLMVFYNPTSIMSLGVMLFQVYFVVMLLWIITLYHDGWLTQLETVWHRPALAARARKLTAMIVKRAAVIENLLLVLAILLGCYTGFLLSALKSFPMLNNPVLPVLFLVSGTTSGIAVMLLASAWGRNTSGHSRSLHFIHRVETPVVYAELFLLFAFFIGLLLGGGQKVVAAQTALSGFWGGVFWIGIIGIGIVIPFIANQVRKPSAHPGKGQLITLATMSLFGVFLLRLFVLYAGQMTVA